LIKTVTEVKVPRRMDWRVMIPNQVSIWLIHDDPTGVKWKLTRGLRGEQGSVGPVQARLGVGSAEYGDLVA